MGRIKDYLFPTKEKSIYETTTMDTNNPQEKKYSSATLMDNQEMPSKPEVFVPQSPVAPSPTIVQEPVVNATPQIYKPIAYQEVESLAHELLNHRPIIVSLKETEKSTARRICDFLTGVCYALNGEVKKIDKLVYLFSI